MYASMITQQLAPGRLAPGRRVYAVGDVHGCADQLFDLHARIARHLAEQPGPAPLLVHLGDYVDRGPASAQVVDRLRLGSPLRGVPMVNLMGNHEWMMLRALALDDAQDAREWLANGGDASLESWGVPAGAPRQDWPARFPVEHLAFLRDLKPYYRLDGYVFVHAGVRPEVPLAEQHRHDLLWIRRDFLDWEGPLLPEAPAVAAVHGHTPTAAPELRANRIGVDTGAVRGGKLTCAVLEEDQVGFLQV
jgi:serine/threonine protein phosphatase 1